MAFQRLSAFHRGTAPLPVGGLALWVSHCARVYRVLGPASSRSKGPGYSSNGIPRQSAADRSVSSMAGPKCVQHGQVSGTPGLGSQSKGYILSLTRSLECVGHSPKRRVFGPRQDHRYEKAGLCVHGKEQFLTFYLLLKVLGNMRASFKTVPYARFYSRLI